MHHFVQAQRLVGSWLRQSGRGIRALDLDGLSAFPNRDVCAGWQIPTTIDNVPYRLSLLLCRGFPFNRARVAICSEQVFLRWPHVEADGVVCLPPFPFSFSAPAENAARALSAAADLIRLSAGQSNEEEFQREFISYWAHQPGCENAKRFVTLFDPSGPARNLFTYELQRAVAISDSDNALKNWLTNSGVNPERELGTGLYLPLQLPLVPPFPETANAVLRCAREKLSIADRQILDDPQIRNQTLRLIFRSEVSDLRGMVGATIRGSASQSGFRPGHAPFSIFAMRATYEPTTVVRGDAQWIHGRDSNPKVDALAASTAAIVGCGALGSHVAFRLAQSGVGNFILVDPETLESANVGRHLLGMESLKRGKADGLAQRLKLQFPHLGNVTSFTASIEGLRDIQQVLGADVIVSTVGEAGPELFLNHAHLSSGATKPVVYGWMEERAMVAHALTIAAPSHCLQCFLDDEGNAKSPETSWLSTQTLRQEPGCGNYFQPYGPADVGHAELLVSEAVLKVLNGSSENQHVVYAAASARLNELGGSWTEYHLQERPTGWSGPLTFVRALPPPDRCTSGLHHP